MLYRWIVPAIFLALVPGLVQAQLPDDGPHAAALSYSTVAFSNIPGTFSNPSAVAGALRPGASLWAAQLYGLPELTVASGSVVLPMRFLATGFSVRAFGQDGYREFEYRLAIGRRFRPGTTRSLTAGVAVSVNRLSIESYGSSSALSFAAGWTLPLTPALALGFAATNLTNAGYASGLEALPRTMSVGIAWQPAGTLLVTASGYAESGYPVSFRSGIEVIPVGALALRFGVSTNPSRFTTGVGLGTRAVRGDLAFMYHDPLGWTPVLGVTLQP